MTNTSSIVVILLLVALVLGSLASIRAQADWTQTNPTFASQVSEFGPTPGPFNPDQQPPDDLVPRKHG